MGALTFRAWRDGRYVALGEILVVLGPRILDLSWTLRLVDVAPHPRAHHLEAVPPDKSLGTLELIHLVTPDLQIVDGEVTGSADGLSPKVMIRAVDSTSWDIESDDVAVLSAIKYAFPDAAELDC